MDCFITLKARSFHTKTQHSGLRPVVQILDRIDSTLHLCGWDRTDFTIYIFFDIHSAVVMVGGGFQKFTSSLVSLALKLLDKLMDMIKMEI